MSATLPPPPASLFSPRGWAEGRGRTAWADEAAAVPPPHEELLQSKARPGSVRAGLSVIVFLGQWFPPVIAVSGALGSNPRFSWVSMRVLCSVLVFLGLTWMGVSLLLYGRHMYTLVEFLKRFVFFVCAGVTAVLYVALSRHWKQLVLSFDRAEVLTGEPWGCPPRIATRLRLLAAVSMALPLVEHVYLLVLHTLNFVPESVRGTASLAECIEIFHKEDRPYMIPTMPEHVFFYILIQLVVEHGTLLSVYNDVFLMLIGLAVSERLSAFVCSLSAARTDSNVTMDVFFWRDARERYTALYQHLQTVDTICSPLILMSFLWNVGGLCMNMYGSLRESDDFAFSTYSMVAVVALVYRVGGLSYALTSVSEHRARLLRLLHTVPSRSYCAEVRRFILQVSSDDIALTGGKSFKITRPFLMGMVGTIITYEIVLIQVSSQIGTKS